ncbi:MAG: 2-oxoacid:acceptor oxidoreductase family protein [Bacillota bacterium]|jgi:2-oxoglutarate ferredoxin oxidoreductase subunit gamma
MGIGAKIVIAGEGGQGIQSIANMITEAAYEEGREALYIPNFGVEQRGGVSVAYVQISDEPIGSPKFKTADIAMAMSKRSVMRIAKYCDSNTLFLYEGGIEISEDELPKQCKAVIAVPAIKISKEELHPKVFNVLMMGVVIGLSKVVGVETIKGTIESKLGYKFEKQPQLREMNYVALDKGIELAAQHAVM